MLMVLIREEEVHTKMQQAPSKSVGNTFSLLQVLNETRHEINYLLTQCAK
jgi:hypothetical protein